MHQETQQTRPWARRDRPRACGPRLHLVEPAASWFGYGRYFEGSIWKGMWWPPTSHLSLCWTGQAYCHTFFFPHQVEETVWYKLLYSFPPHLGGQMWPVANVVSCFGDTIIWISTSKIHESTDLLLRSMVNGNEPQTGDTIWIVQMCINGTLAH